MFLIVLAAAQSFLSQLPFRRSQIRRCSFTFTFSASSSPTLPLFSCLSLKFTSLSSSAFSLSLSPSLSLSLSLYIYIYIYIFLCLSLCLHLSRALYLSIFPSIYLSTSPSALRPPVSIGLITSHYLTYFLIFPLPLRPYQIHPLPIFMHFSHSSIHFFISC